MKLLESYIFDNKLSGSVTILGPMLGDKLINIYTMNLNKSMNNTLNNLNKSLDKCVNNDIVSTVFIILVIFYFFNIRVFTLIF